MSITLTPDGKHLCLRKHLYNVYQTTQETLCLAALTSERTARERLKGYKYLCENLGSLTVPWRLKNQWWRSHGELWGRQRRLRGPRLGVAGWCQSARFRDAHFVCANVASTGLVPFENRKRCKSRQERGMGEVGGAVAWQALLGARGRQASRKHCSLWPRLFMTEPTRVARACQGSWTRIRSWGFVGWGERRGTCGCFLCGLFHNTGHILLIVPRYKSLVTVLIFFNKV